MSSAKFQLIKIKYEQKISVLTHCPFDIAVTRKYNQGHWKGYEWVKLHEFYHHAKFDIYHIYSDQENLNVKFFATYGPASLMLIIT